MEKARMDQKKRLLEITQLRKTARVHDTIYYDIILNGIVN
jgi:hypothetical protein